MNFPFGRGQVQRLVSFVEDLDDEFIRIYAEKNYPERGADK